MTAYLPYISTVISVGSIILSIFSYRHAKNCLFAETVAKQRFLWIQDVRSKLNLFVEHYLSVDTPQDTLLRAKYAVEFLLNRENDEHQALLSELNRCVAERNNDRHLDKLMEKSQFVLNRTWQRAKIEAGMSWSWEKSRDKRIKKKHEEKKGSTT
ncbi:MAG: hypothetical protein LBT36_02255 [Oscillospiraceae bacterium]|nr:hypothetical protein [Oscillospiraceae bacterium]